MHAVRMIKLFGWEMRVQQNISVRREEELRLVWRRKLLQMGVSIVKKRTAAQLSAQFIHIPT